MNSGVNVSYTILTDGKVDVEKMITTVYDEQHEAVFKFLMSFTGNRNDAEDLTQEVFIQVLNSIAKYNRAFQLRTWIFSIAKHIAIDHYRRKKFYSLFNNSFFTNMDSKIGLPDKVLETKETMELVQKAVTKLKPNYRAVFILRCINEMSIKETSAILECTESKVKVDYHRALGMLRKKLNLPLKGGWNDEL